VVGTKTFQKLKTASRGKWGDAVVGFTKTEKKGANEVN